MSRRKRREKESPAEAPKPTPTAEVLRRRRNKRLLILGTIALVIPVLELIAYRYRAITITIANKTPFPIANLKFTYSGGSFTTPEIRAEDEFTRVIRPDFSFTRDEFSSYKVNIEFESVDARHREQRKIFTLDYSCLETYVVQPGPALDRIEIKQKTSPGFPLSAIRELLARMGIG